MKVVIISLAVITFIACLFLGLYLGGGLSVATSKSTPGVLSPLTKTSIEQHTVVLIQADDLTLSSPHLVGMWLLFYYPEYPQLTLLMLYPPMSDNNRGKIWALGQQFALTSNGKLSPIFLTLLQNFGFKSNGYIVIDNYGLTQWVDWLGGITMGDDHGVQNGSTILSTLPNGDNNEQNTGKWMKQVSMGVCSKLIAIPVDSNWATLMNSVAPDHFHSDLSLELLMGDWKKLKSHDQAITCEFDIP